MRRIVACLTAVVAVGLFASGSAGADGLTGRIAFSTGFVIPYQDRDVGSQVWTVNPDGSALRQLTHVAGGRDAAEPAWSPDGSRIAYQSDPTGEYDLWVMNGDGSRQHLLLKDAGFDDEQPAWSPDGRRIAFARCDGFFECDIDVVNSNGTGMHRIIGGHRVNTFPRFSPDGKWIAFTSDRAGLSSAIWKVRIDGTGLQRLTAPQLEAFAPSWSPDGSRILFTSDCCLPYSEVYVMNADGSGLRRLTHSATGHQAGFARFAPDGRHMVFMSDRAYPDASSNDLFTSLLDGAGLHRLTHNATFVGEIADWGRTP
jgi:Tol biopolymer transport system component